MGISGWSFSPILARMLVGAELFLGFSILINTTYLRQYLNATLIVTGFFSFYLLLLWAFRGNDVNCGCFGTVISMSPAESLMKNAVLMVLIAAALKTKPHFEKKYNWIHPVVAIITLVVPFVLNVVEFERRNPDSNEYPFAFPEHHLAQSYQDSVDVSLAEGEYLLAFFSTGCSHCKVAAQKLGIVSRKYKIPPVKVFFIGSHREVAGFFKESNASFDYVLFNNQAIHKITNGTFPTVFYVQDGQVIRQWTGGDLSYNEMGILHKTLNSDIKDARR